MAENLKSLNVASAAISIDEKVAASMAESSSLITAMVLVAFGRSDEDHCG